MSKNQLGQFYTTNYNYILQNMYIPDYVDHIIEPFVGRGDLLGFLNKPYTFELYDIDPKCENTIVRDTLMNPPCYKNKFVLTNPPYLARNKCSTKTVYDKYKCNDMYKCFIQQLIENVCQGGIVIIPLNFISSIRKADIDLRRCFLEKYRILRINIFEERVFDDTSYAICSIQFVNTENTRQREIDVDIYPSRKHFTVTLSNENNYTIGGEIYNLPTSSDIRVERLTSKTKHNDYITNILLKCIDDSAENRLGFRLVSDHEKFIDDTPRLSARSYAILIINKKLSLSEQEILVMKMNTFINEYRDKYNSLFLTNYRESNTIARKRISFDLAFRICNYILMSSSII